MLNLDMWDDIAHHVCENVVDLDSIQIITPDDMKSRLRYERFPKRIARRHTESGCGCIWWSSNSPRTLRLARISSDYSDPLKLFRKIYEHTDRIEQK